MDPIRVVLPLLCVVFCALLSYLVFAVLRGRTRKKSGKQGSYWLTCIGALVGFFLTALVAQLIFSRVRLASPLVWMWVFYAVLLVDAVLGAVAGYFVRQRPAGQGGTPPPG